MAADRLNVGLQRLGPAVSSCNKALATEEKSGHDELSKEFAKR